MIKAIFFDLFFTLIIPAYDKENNEFEIVNLSMHEWEKYAEADYHITDFAEILNIMQSQECGL